jgi:hypothetical protein
MKEPWLAQLGPGLFDSARDTMLPHGGLKVQSLSNTNGPPILTQIIHKHVPALDPFHLFSQHQPTLSEFYQVLPIGDCVSRLQALFRPRSVLIARTHFPSPYA